MPSKYGIDSFYHSKAWRSVSAAYMSSKHYLCERCGKPATICHHKKWLNAHNVTDPTVSLNPDNLEAVCIECHNAIHTGSHATTIFDNAGSVIAVKESQEIRLFKSQSEKIDDVVERARSLLCGFK